MAGQKLEKIKMDCKVGFAILQFFILLFATLAATKPLRGIAETSGYIVNALTGCVILIRISFLVLCRRCPYCQTQQVANLTIKIKVRST